MHTRTFPGLGFDPTPGSATDVEAVLTRLARVASAVDRSAHGLRRSTRAGGWRGEAASAFRSSTSGLAGGFDEVVTALRTTSRAMSAWQTRLVANQHEAERLEAAARRLRLAQAESSPNQANQPAQAARAAELAAELARVLDDAHRLRARHLRQAHAAADAIRSAVGSAPAWPSDSTGRQAGRVSRWTGDLAAAMAVPVWPPASWPGGEGASLHDLLLGAQSGVTPPPGMDAPGFWDTPGESADGSDVDGRPGRFGVPGGGPLIRPFEPEVTAPAGWLDTAAAPAVRPPLEQLPSLRPAPTFPADFVGADRFVRPAEPSARSDRLPHRPVARADTGHPVSRGENAVERGGRGVGPTGGGGGETRGRGRLGGQPAPGTPGGPGGPAGVVDKPGPRVASGGGPAATTGALPANPPADPPADPPPVDQPVDQTVEQHAAPAERPALDRPLPDQSDHRGPAPTRGPDPARLPDQARLDSGRVVGLDPGRLEPGRLVGADPTPRPAPPATASPTPTKTRDSDADAGLAAFVFGPLPDDGDTRASGPGGLRAFLMRRPDARPVLVLIRPGREPLFVTGLTPCASPLSDCATTLPAAATPDVY